MRINGSIRRGSGKIDIAFVQEGVWHQLASGALKTNIEQLYNFLMSDEDRATLFGRIYKKRRSRTKTNNNSTSVSFNGGMCSLLLTKYEKTKDGRPAPSDRAMVEMIFDTVDLSEDALEDDSGAYS